MAVEPEVPEATARTAPAVPLLPLKNAVVFPSVLHPLGVGRPRSLALLEALPAGDRILAMAAQIDETVEEAGLEHLHDIATLVRVQHQRKLPDGTYQVAVLGLERIRLTAAVQTEPFLVAEYEPLPEGPSRVTGVEGEALVRSATQLFQKLVELAPYLDDDLGVTALNIEDRLHLAYFLANHGPLSTEQRQEILELPDDRSKLERLLGHLSHELEVLELGKKIKTRAEEQMGRAQREYFLREQLKAIQRELGELDVATGDIVDFRRRIDEADLPAEARKEADRELARLERIPSASPESSVIRTYLELVCSLPWNVHTGGEADVARAREILDADHYDLDKVKQRIVEHLAVRRLKQLRGADEQAREPILCFVGPPGVGKTSLGHSIARAMGRKFTRASLGGVHDEAEIRGHRRTYIGAMPGRIIQAIRRAETSDPVFMLDEIDKLASDWRGDPSSALLEVLDPEQNKDFRDNYLDVPFDLSRVMFICTANYLDTVPGALRDRLEVLHLSGYTEHEKVEIARRFLIPKQLTAHALKPEEVDFSEPALRKVIAEHTREAGVRNLEREIASVLRRVAADVAEEKLSELPVVVDEERVRDALGKRRYFGIAAERIDRPGVAIGMVWTSVGGEILFVEVSLFPGKGDLRLTGQLGDVMRESAHAAVSWLKAHAGELGIEPEHFTKRDIHVHVPAGAQPKEGPSAGVTVLTALASALTGRPARDDVAMTGEITLRGRVLPIGGVKEKVLGAHRAGLRRIVLPARNEADLDDIPADLREELEISLVETIDEVLALALPKPEGSAPPPASPESPPARPRRPRAKRTP